MDKITCILILCALFSCQKRKHDFERTLLTVQNQKFEVLTANKIFQDLISGKSNYSKDVYPKIENEFKDNAEFPFLLETLKTEIEPDSRLEEEMELMGSIDFNQIVQATFKRVVKELPGPDTKILFIPLNPAHKELFESYGVGLYAITPGQGKIIVSINPTIKNWDNMLPFALAHEYHHSVWTSRNFERPDLSPLEYLLLEGRADAFAIKLFPNTQHPFLKVLSANQEQQVWSIIKSELHVRNSGLNDKLMSGTSEIPTGSVYSIGYSIIESFKINNPGINDKALIDMNPKNILELSKYDEK